MRACPLRFGAIIGVMSNKTTIALAVAAGFFGGIVSQHIALTPVFAQSPAPATMEVRARKFVLVDENGTARGVFGFRSDGSPEIQASFAKRKGILKYVESEFFSVRWMGESEKNILPDLKPIRPATTAPPNASE